MNAIRWRRLVARTISALLLINLGQQAHAQGTSGLMLGELQVTVEGDNSSSALISVFPGSAVFGSRGDWYPAIPGNSYQGTTPLRCEHVDRPGGAFSNVIGYGLYTVTVDGHYILVDYRDADYETAAYSDCDVCVFFDRDLQQFYRMSGNTKIWMVDGGYVGAWQDGRKNAYGGAPRIPVTVRNSFEGGYGGSVIVDNEIHASPCEIVWNLDTHTIGAFGKQRRYWLFDYWSDGGQMIHDVEVDLGIFGAVYTAYYYEDPKFAGSGKITLQNHPNPFNPTTVISYTVEDRCEIYLAILDVLGREIDVLAQGISDGGTYHATFDGSGVASGVYYVRLSTDAHTTVHRIVLTK